jgi:hypothetical protein
MNATTTNFDLANRNASRADVIAWAKFMTRDDMQLPKQTLAEFRAGPTKLIEQEILKPGTGQYHCFRGKVWR